MFDNKIKLYPPSKRPEPDREILVCSPLSWYIGEYWPDNDKFYNWYFPITWIELKAVGWIYTDMINPEVINA